MPDDFFKNRTFLTPAFEIRLNGVPAGRAVLADVLDVTFVDDLQAIDSFEFSINDWDPIALRPKYSSPWDAEGNPYRMSEDGPEVPNFEPGTLISLFMGYRDEGGLPLIMEAEVVSVSTTFPASGQPVAKVRALDAFQRGMQKTWVEGNYSGTAKAIVSQLCRENAIAVQWATLASEGAEQARVQIDGPLYDEIERRARDYGLVMVTLRDAAGVTLQLASPAADNTKPVAEFHWGRSLMDFAPVLSVAAQVAEVVARGADPDGEGDARGVEAIRRWSDINLSASAMGPASRSDLATAVRGTREVIKPDSVTTLAEAEAAADARLRTLAQDLITGSGSAVGLPELRAGRLITLTGLGARFSGKWRLTRATHTLGGAGYTTSFSARKEVLE